MSNRLSHSGAPVSLLIRSHAYSQTFTVFRRKQSSARFRGPALELGDGVTFPGRTETQTRVERALAEDNQGVAATRMKEH